MKPNPFSKSRLELSAYREGISSGNRVVLSRAITLVESQLEEDRIMAEKLVQTILPTTGKSIRIGITGSPGVGKSSFIEVFGQYLTAMSKKVAVLTVDPSSRRTKGSILGDKTRMENLSNDQNAFIRPSSAGAMLGGVHSNTREAILLCEAAGFNIIIVETIGVGQSEVNVRDMVDFFMLLLLGGAGDELQGIKRGIMEMADGIVITKADGENLKKAKEAQANYQHAIHFLPSSSSVWVPKVLLCSALENSGMKLIWKSIENFKTLVSPNNFFSNQRQQQNKEWFYAAIQEGLNSKITQAILLREHIHKLEKKVILGEVTPPQASRKIIEKFIRFLGEEKGGQGKIKKS